MVEQLLELLVFPLCVPLLGCLGLLEGCLLPIALGLNLQNHRMMHQSVNRCDRHHRISKDTVPLTERLIGCNHQALALIAMCNQLKQHTGFCLTLLDIAQVVNH